MVSRVSKVRMVGPLAPHQSGFELALAEVGYTPLSAASVVGVMAHLSRWLGASGMGAADLTSEVASAFLSARRAAGYTCWLSPKGLRPLLDHLRGLGVAPTPGKEAALGPLEKLLDRYRGYLVAERGLVPASVERYLRTARLFLARIAAGDESRLEAVTAAEVTAFVVAESGRRGRTDAKYLVTGLRSVLRFLVLAGVITRDLSGAVPGVAGWRSSGLPKGLSPEQVVALLESCDRSHFVGRRDLAILTLLVRLGLRACEVARLRLEDFDWRRGEVIIRGKGWRDERLPLPPDVGEAVVAYLREDNNRGAAREVFVNARAPFASMTSSGVKNVVRRGGVRAGLGKLGAHRLRHTAATQMLRAGTPLVEVGEVLRHRSLTTTAIYAKVDRVALRALARPWPGVAA